MYHITMWVAKLKISGISGVVGSRTKKHNVSVAGHIISVNKKKDYLYVDIAGFVYGDKKNKERFVEDLRKAREVSNFEVNGDFIIAQVRDPVELEPAYSTGVMHLEPVVIDSKGDNYYTIGSWKRNELNIFLNFMHKKYNAEIVRVENKKISNFFILSFKPELTGKQKEAFELAIKQGYYDYPRKTSIEKLAKISGVAFSAFHAHLRKAEKKLLPYSI